MRATITDPAEQERIIRSFLERRAAAKKSKRFKWADVFSCAEPICYCAIFMFGLLIELLLKAHGHATGVSTYFYFILFGAIWIFRIECRMISQSKRLDEIYAALVEKEKSELNQVPEPASGLTPGHGSS